MKYNSKQNYNHGVNYNNVTRVRVWVFPYHEKFSLSEDLFFQFIHVVNAKDSPVSFSDSGDTSFGLFKPDFSIGTSSGKDSAVDWFSPLGMKVDWSSTSLQVMPTSESEYTDMPNVDGSMLGNTTYKNRSFSFVLYSDDGLSETEKYDLKQKIARILDRTKQSFKKLSISPGEHYFDVKYSGSASVQDGPSFVKATLPFEVKPYSHPMFPVNEMESGTITNNGLKACGLRVEITGSVSSPSFTVKSGESSKEFTWSSSLSESETLIIDGESLLCYTVSSDGSKSNAITSLSPSGKESFVTIQPGESVEVIPSSGLKGHVIFSINESYIW